MHEKLSDCTDTYSRVYGCGGKVRGASPFPRRRGTLLTRDGHKGLAAKTIHNYAHTLSALFNYAVAPQRRWASANPCLGVELPGVAETDEIRFLDEAEWEAVLRHVQPVPYEAIDRALYLTALMAGLRHGELCALRWRDVDWIAGRVRSGRTGCWASTTRLRAAGAPAACADGRPSRASSTGSTRPWEGRQRTPWCSPTR
jgi:integrase